MHKLHHWHSVMCDPRWLQCGLCSPGHTRNLLAGQGICQSAGVACAYLEQKGLHVPVALPHGRKEMQWLHVGSPLHKEGQIPGSRLAICTICKWSYSLRVINSSVLNPDTSPISLAGDCHHRWCDAAEKPIQHEFVLPMLFMSNETTR